VAACAWEEGCEILKHVKTSHNRTDISTISLKNYGCTKVANWNPSTILQTELVTMEMSSYFATDFQVSQQSLYNKLSTLCIRKRPPETNDWRRVLLLS
jgi:hypothetical protein